MFVADGVAENTAPGHTAPVPISRMFQIGMHDRDSSLMAEMSLRSAEYGLRQVSTLKTCLEVVLGLLTNPLYVLPNADSPPRSAFPAANKNTTAASSQLLDSLNSINSRQPTISQHDYPQARRQLPQRRCVLVSCDYHKVNSIRVNSHRQSSYIPYSPESGDITACGIPISYNASKEWADKKVVLFSVPGECIAILPLFIGRV